MIDISEFNPVQTTPFSLKVKIKSHLWKLINATLFRVFPNQIKKPRIYLLRLFGATLSDTVNINRTAKIDHPWNLTMGNLSSLGNKSWAYCLDKIIIGEKCCIGEYSYLITGSHNLQSTNFEMTTKPIVIKDGCWITTGVYIMPGVILGEFSVVGAKSLVVKNTDPYSIVAGNPARHIKKREINKLHIRNDFNYPKTS